jgi:hypothetical protein
MREVQVGGSESKVCPRQKARDLIREITKAKKIVKVAQVVELLPSNCQGPEVKPQYHQ